MYCTGYTNFLNMTHLGEDKRSGIMRAVKSKGNRTTELQFISILREYHIKGWRRHYAILGNPDFVFVKQKIAVFVDGCFWHGHSCRNLTPSTNVRYWKLKIKRNKIRDVTVRNGLKKRGWGVCRIWECELRNERSVGKFMKYIICLMK